MKVHLVQTRKFSLTVDRHSGTTRQTLNFIRVERTNAILKFGISYSANITMMGTGTIQSFRVKTLIQGWDSNGWRASFKTYRQTSIPTSSCRSFVKLKKSVATYTVKTVAKTSRSKSSRTTFAQYRSQSVTGHSRRTKDVAMSSVVFFAVLYVMRRCLVSSVRSCMSSSTSSVTSWSTSTRK